jgi:hypothetical protein
MIVCNLNKSVGRYCGLSMGDSVQIRRFIRHVVVRNLLAKSLNPM